MKKNITSGPGLGPKYFQMATAGICTREKFKISLGSRAHLVIGHCSHLLLKMLSGYKYKIIG